MDGIIAFHRHLRLLLEAELCPVNEAEQRKVHPIDPPTASIHQWGGFTPKASERDEAT